MRDHIIFFCETEEIAQQFIKNPEYFQTPIEKMHKRNTANKVCKI